MKANWTNELVTTFINVILHYVAKNGNFTDNGFKKKDWSSITSEFESATNLSYDKSSLQSKYSELKKKYNVFKKLKDQSGFGWDEEKQILTADDETWEAYIQVHSEAKAFRKATLPNLELLESLFSGKVATGSYAKSSTEANTIVPDKHLRSTSSRIAQDDDNEDYDEDEDGDRSINCVNVEHKGSSAKRGLSTSYQPSKKRLNHSEMVCAALQKLVDRENPQQKVMKEALNKLMQLPKFKVLTPLQKLKVKAKLAKDQEALLFNTYGEDEAVTYIDEILQQ
jgi:hypothetical protein